MKSNTISSPVPFDLEELLPAFSHLDYCLEKAVAIAQIAYGVQSVADDSQGLHIDPAEIEKILMRPSGSPLFWLDDNLESLPSDGIQLGSRLAHLQQVFGLSVFDVNVIVLALAPIFDLRYESLYAYLQNHAMRRRPSVDLALNLFCSDIATKLSTRQRFTSDAPLIRHGLMTLQPERHQESSSILGFTLQLDEHISRFLLGIPGLNDELNNYCEWVNPTADLAHIGLTSDIVQGLQTLLYHADFQPLSLYFHGPSGLGQTAVADAIAHTLSHPLIKIDLRKILKLQQDAQYLLRRIAMVAQLHHAVLYVDGWDSVRSSHPALAPTSDAAPTPAPPSHSDSITEAQLVNLLPTGGTILIAGKQPWQLSMGRWYNTITVPFAIPTTSQRRQHWQTQLQAVNADLTSIDLTALADRFHFTFEQIQQAIARAYSHRQWRAACQVAENDTSANQDNQAQKSSIVELKRPLITDLFSAARAQSGHELRSLARKISPSQTWDQLILSPKPLEQLQEICNQAKYRERVYNDWGFDRIFSKGKGLTVLFSGPPGTGKTMAAEIIANELHLDLYKIDLSQIVSKYIGETEKNLNRIFTAAQQANAILLFDEADAIFGKRSEVKDAHDRYANLEVAYLLQKMEEFEGISILTTNFRQNLDDAFTRRINFLVEFPFPEEDSRLQIWQSIWPSEAPVDDDIDFPLLAKQFKLAGGNIRNIVLAAAFLAANDDGSVHLHHILQAIRRETQKMGRLVNEAEFLPFQSNQVPN